MAAATWAAEATARWRAAAAWAAVGTVVVKASAVMARLAARGSEAAPGIQCTRRSRSRRIALARETSWWCRRSCTQLVARPVGRELVVALLAAPVAGIQCTRRSHSRRIALAKYSS